MTTNDDDGIKVVTGSGSAQNEVPEVTEAASSEYLVASAVPDASYETKGRIDPIYEPAVQQYHAPVAESRSFWSRFWWFIPVLLLLVLLPILLHSCNRAEACSTLPTSVWNSALQDSTWATVSAFDSNTFTTEHREQVLAELAFLCNQRLAGHTVGANDVINRFSQFTLETGVTNNLLTFVNGNTFCRCQ